MRTDLSSCGGDRRVPKPKIYTSGSLLKKVYTVGPVGKSASVSIAFLLHKRKTLIREADEFYCAVCKLCLIEAVKNKNVSAMGVIMPHKGSEQMLNKRHVDQHARGGREQLLLLLRTACEASRVALRTPTRDAREPSGPQPEEAQPGPARPGFRAWPLRPRPFFPHRVLPSKSPRPATSRETERRR